MLLVRAHRGSSRTHGSGLIAEEFIPQGTVVWKFLPGFDVAFPESELPRLSSAAREQLIYWSYFHQETRTFILSSDDDRFTNHSENPNVRSFHECGIAVRDIHPGEEITNDYTELVVLNFPNASEIELSC